MAKVLAPNSVCPCGGEAYTSCCQPYHQDIHAPTAEALMRSRYTAYTLGLEDYLLKTWHPDTRPATIGLVDEASTQWLGLQVKQAVTTSEDAAIVEFIAKYKMGGRAYRLHEISRFTRLDGRWLYLDGDLDP